MCEKVLGYANLPTAQVMLMLENESGWSDLFREWTIAEHEGDVDELAQVIKDAVGEWFDIEFYESQAGYLGDLLTFGFDIIDWYEIASEWKYKIQEEQNDM